MRCLHVGCGGQRLPGWFPAGFDEVRLDIDSSHSPDIVADMRELGEIGSFEAAYSSHSLEHLTPEGAKQALRELRRVVTGFAIVVVPDLEDIRPTNEVVYVSDAGPITGHDMHYGLASKVDANPHMAHRSGYVQETLRSALLDAGFTKVTVERQQGYNLVAVAG